MPLSSQNLETTLKRQTFLTEIQKLKDDLLSKDNQIADLVRANEQLTQDLKQVK